MASHVLSKEERNFYCFAIASVDLIKLPLIDILTDCIKPVDLYAKINCTPGLQLRPHQKKLCCLEPPLLPDYSKFDVTLLYTLIRNLCPSLTPTRGWGHKLNPMDTNIGDDIERLRLYRNNFYAHSLSPVIPDNDFGEYWSDLKSVIKRISTFTNESRKYNYEKELLKIEGFSFVNEDRVIYETLLKDTLNQWNQLEYKYQDEQAILIKGPEKVLFGEKAQFDAEIKQTGTSKWLVTWHKKTGDSIANINIRDEKFKRSTDRQLLIHSACKDDEAEYQAVISDGNNNYLSNAIYLHVLGEPPYIDNWNFTSDTEGLTIHCSYGVPEGSPSDFEVKWTKNTEILDLTNKKYVAGRSSDDGSRLNESYLMISSLGLEDKGIYSCTVTNAVGSASKDVTLDVPSAKILTDSEVMFGLKTTIKPAVVSSPPPNKVQWQNSNDGKTFHQIDISESHYYGSSLSPESPLLVIPYTTFDDTLYYRLLLGNKIGDQFSNTLYLKVTGYPPNIMTNHQTCIKERTVKLICEVFPYDPENVFWSINGEKIGNSKCEVEYSEVTVKDPSLTIFNVNKQAAGFYQVTASNAEGSTQSDVIVLDKPQITLKRRQKSDGRQVFKALIDSIPSAYIAQWKVKGKDDKTYTPVKSNAEEYKGTSNSLPHPVLVLKQRELLEKQCFLIEVDNFVGKSVKEILCNDNSNKSYRTKGKESTEWEKKGDSRVVSNDSELSSDSNTDDEESNWKKEDGEGKKLAKKKQKAKDMTFLRPTTGHLFSKGIQNQKDVLPSIVRAEVSKSVGLIHIDTKAEGTGFLVGEKYILTCAHVIQDPMKATHVIDSKRISIEFGRTLFNKKEDPLQIFKIKDIKYLDREYDFAVLELDAKDTGVPFPPALTCFGNVCCSDVYLVGHPNCRQMMEDNVIPLWLPEHKDIILPDIEKFGIWSKGFFPDGVDYYDELSYLPRKIMFHTTFNHGSSGSPGVVIKDEKPCVVLMMRGGVPACINDGKFPTYAPEVKDEWKVEYGYAMQDIYEKMRNSSLETDRNLASEIFKAWKW